MDFTRDTLFRDDPTDFFKGSLLGPDGETMRVYAVDDNKVRSDIAKSVLSRVSFRAVSDPIPYCATGGSTLFAGDPTSISLLIVVLDTQS